MRIVVVILMMLSACSREGSDVWEDIDYAKIAQQNYLKENDSAYVPPPSVIGCTDDDLSNCKTH